MLVNSSDATPVKVPDCLFQPQIKVSTDNNSFLFAESQSGVNTDNADEETKSLELLYRNKKKYGTGLGVSVDWDINEEGKGSIWSDFFPEYEVPPMNFSLPKNEEVLPENLSMKYLSDLSSIEKSEKISVLKKFVDLYKTWVDDLEKTVETIDVKHVSAAKKNIAECIRAYERMYSGIDILNESLQAYSAFCLANRAMFMQRVHLKMQNDISDTERYPGDEEIVKLLDNMDYKNEDDSNCVWRPFQIAFILMDIESIVKENSPDRDLVDLIWFPTGGGKTEA